MEPKRFRSFCGFSSICFHIIKGEICQRRSLLHALSAISVFVYGRYGRYDEYRKTIQHAYRHIMKTWNNKRYKMFREREKREPFDSPLLFMDEWMEKQTAIPIFLQPKINDKQRHQFTLCCVACFTTLRSFTCVIWVVMWYSLLLL